MTAATEPAALSRRHAAGAASARGLLFTILGEYVLPAGGVTWTSAMIGAMDRLGVEEKATRQALMRTAADGWLTAERVGRRTRWRLTPSADRLLTDGAERIYGFGPHRELLGWLMAAGPGPHAGDRAAVPACAAQSADVGGPWQPGARRLDQHARRTAGRGRAGAG